MKEKNTHKNRDGYIGLGIMIVLACLVVFGSAPLYQVIDDRVRPKIYTPGTYTGSARGYGGMVTVQVKVTAKAIESMDVTGEKETLLEMVLPGLTDTMIAKQSSKVDGISGATLSSNAIKEAADQALAQARGEAVQTKDEIKKEPVSENTADWIDGTYIYHGTEYDENGYKDHVEMTIEGNTITALTWNGVDKDGTSKRKLSMEGKYVMTEEGPKWHEQADAVANYVLENQSLEGLIDENGYTDAVSSVSINLYGFVNGVKDCLRQAASN